MGPIKATIGLELIAVEPARHVAWKYYSWPISREGEDCLESVSAGGTQLSQEGSLTFHGLWRLLLEPVVGAEIIRGELKELERLKAVVETS